MEAKKEGFTRTTLVSFLSNSPILMESTIPNGALSLSMGREMSTSGMLNTRFPLCNEISGLWSGCVRDVS